MPRLSEAELRSEEEPLRIHELDALAEGEARETGLEVLIADRRLVVERVEDVEEEVGLVALGDVPDITDAQVDRRPLVVGEAADRARFYSRETVRAARILADIGARDQFRGLMLYIDDVLPNAQETALLVDMARGYGDQDLAMRAVRAAAQRGIILPERGYPLLHHHFTPVPGAAETAFVYSISRQESNFDPEARSGVGARGMMQLMPGTARELAVDPNDPGENVQGGVTYLKQLLERYAGSRDQLVLALAAYNAGPGAVERYRGLPPYAETHAFVRRVIERFLRLAEARPTE